MALVRFFLCPSSIPVHICTTYASFICRWSIRVLLCLGYIVNSAALKIGVLVSFQIRIFSGSKPRTGIAGSYANFTLSFFFFFNFFLFILFLAVLGLRFCARAFSSCGKRGPLFIAVRGPHYRGLSCCGAQAPDAQAQ